MGGWLLPGVLAAVAVLASPGSGQQMRRLVTPPTRVRTREPVLLKRRAPRPEPLAAAAAFDLFAVCVRAGMPVGGAAMIAAEHAPTAVAELLRRASDMLALGADAAEAWAVPASADPSAQALGAMARRSARAGSSPASGLAELAESERATAQDSAAAAAERAGVAISGPLGLCFLPAFICLGIVPVVIGLAGDVLGGGLL
ncbi:type II secretion system F family protein [Williamsia sterculiae]|uniref:type II secretion system F family protein n=1 Tax=Williamsia sterculiae TaxID=1344003 RepID=UPI0009712A8E|nr:type II secretion system F family protein [Williamsia sterculiae]